MIDWRDLTFEGLLPIYEFNGHTNTIVDNIKQKKIFRYAS